MLHWTPFDSLHPTYIPIPPHTARCKYNCGCQRNYIPLTLAFGKTIHSFQGKNVGPTLPHHPENPIQTIVVDPGTRVFEGSSPGLLYSVISRITTLGYPHDIFTSPLFFTGFNMTRERLQHITLRNDGRTYAKVLLRKNRLPSSNSATNPRHHSPPSKNIKSPHGFTVTDVLLQQSLPKLCCIQHFFPNSHQYNHP